MTHAEQGNFLVAQKMQLKLGYPQNAKGFVSALQTQSVILSLEVILITPHDRDFLPNKMQSFYLLFWEFFKKQHPLNSWTVISGKIRTGKKD